MTAKRVANKAENTPKIMPLIYSNSAWVMMYTPNIMISPNKISYQIIFLLKNKGSIRAAKKAPVENMDKAIEILACFMDAKKVIQCRAIKIPAIENLAKVLGVTTRFMLFNLINMNIKRPAITILNQTSGTALIEISSPRMAVNPAIKTKK